LTDCPTSHSAVEPEGDNINSEELKAQIRAATSEELEQLVLRYADDPRKTIQQALLAASRRCQLADQEEARLASLYELLDSAAAGELIVGLDEVGRGALAGPLLVAAVVLKPEPRIAGLDDSKKLKATFRETLAQLIHEQALAIGFGRVEAERIDGQGMSVCLRLAMLAALDDLGLEPGRILIDGNPLGLGLNERYIVQGDAKVASIAAASIVAKVRRDAWMREYDKAYPGYGFATNKGYGAPAHLEALAQLGPCPIHRRSFCMTYTQEPLF